MSLSLVLIFSKHNPFEGCYVSDLTVSFILSLLWQRLFHIFYIWRSFSVQTSLGAFSYRCGFFLWVPNKPTRNCIFTSLVAVVCFLIQDILYQDIIFSDLKKFLLVCWLQSFTLKQIWRLSFFVFKVQIIVIGLNYYLLWRYSKP